MMTLLIAAFWLANVAAGAADVDVHGTTNAALKPQSGVVVWLEAPPGLRYTRHRRTVLDQRDLQFVPRVLAIQVGTQVEFPNHDRVFHNVFSFHEPAKTAVDIAFTYVVRHPR